MKNDGCRMDGGAGNGSWVREDEEMELALIKEEGCSGVVVVGFGVGIL